MKKYFILIITALILLSLTACKDDQPIHTLPTAPSKTTASKKPVQPNCEATGHDFSENDDICSQCGLDYFSVTLEFELADSCDYYILVSPGECTRTEIVVPASYRGKPVKEIADGAFHRDFYDPVRKNCDKITAITLPECITEIGEYAFKDCWSLAYINIPANVTEIQQYTFYGCFKLQSATVPEGVTVIGERAFSGCEELRTVSLPEGLQIIEKDAFSGCLVLEEIVIPKTVTSLGDGVFSSCRLLESIVLPQEMEEIPFELFFGCSSLQTVEFGDNVQRIGRSAFSGSGLETLILPETVEYIDYHAFAGCRNLRTLQLPSALEEISTNTIIGCNALEFSTYEGICYLGNPDNPYMVMVAMQDDTITDLVIHEDTRFLISKYIGSDIVAEDLYKNLESVYFGRNVEYIENGIFWGSAPLTSIQVSEENPYFHDKNSCLIKTDTKTLVIGCKTSVIPDDGSVTVIGKQAFLKVEGITIMVIPDTITIIKGNAFHLCSDLEAVVIGAGVQCIDHDIFIECEKFDTIYYHGSQIQWEQVDIYGYGEGSGVTFGDNVEIEEATIYYYSETPPTEPGNYWRYVNGIPTPWETEE